MAEKRTPTGCVETISRMAQWSVNNFGRSTYKQSESFQIGIWDWHLSVQRIPDFITIQLVLEQSRTSKEQPPAAKCVLRLSAQSINVSTCYSKGVIRSKDNEDTFAWTVNCNPQGYFVIAVEFHDIKIVQKTGVGGSSSKLTTTKTIALRCLSRMHLESIHADVTINTADNGSLQAHKAILCAASPVFQAMFHHDLIEKQSSTIHIQDMSTDSCAAFLGYLYGTIKPDELRKHRVQLLLAANKYDVSGLKDCCEETFLSDISTGNVFELLQEAWIYQLHKLMEGCFKYLFEFGMIYDLEGEMTKFFTHADRALIIQITQRLLHVWIPRAHLPTVISEEFEIVAL